MLKSILGNTIKEKILFFLLINKEGYARDISRNFKGYFNSYNGQLKILEKGGVLASRLKGRTRIYSFNPRYTFLPELKILLKRAFTFIPNKDKQKFYTPRLRPRRSGKPL